MNKCFGEKVLAMAGENFPVIILENPKYSGNIGMVCRLIANFSLPPLRIIGKAHDLSFEMEWMAYNSKQELDSISYFSSLVEARSDLDIVIGTGMIHGGNRSEFILLSKIPEMVNNKKFGILFGREDRGLSRNSILYCDYMVDFQLPGYQKSMNLSHAIAFVLSSFHTYKENNPTPINSYPNRNKTHFYEYSKSIFKILGMDDYHNNDYLPVRRLKSILEKINLSSGDIDFFYKIFNRIEVLHSKKNKSDN